MNGIIKYPISKGLNFYYIPAKRFKTVDIDVMFYQPLSEESASMNALITPVLKSGTEKYPNAAKLNCRLEELFGASLSASASKSGEASVAKFSMQYVNEKYVSGESMDKDAISLLCDVIFNPILENGAFKKDFFEIERKNLIESIEAMVNDKKSYASWRLKEEMCKGEPFGVFSLGKIDVINKITEKSAYEYYKNSLLKSKCDIFLCGDVDIEQIIKIINSRFEGEFCEEYPKTKIFEKHGEVKRVTEEMDVEQGKLSLGFSCGVERNSKEFFALSMFNKIFGGTAVSKLFNNVREKLSLAYYVSSAIEGGKSIMTINSGIEIPTFKAAYDEIFVQLDMMKKGDFTDEEQAAALASYVNTLEHLKDSPSGLIQFYASQLFCDTEQDPEEYLASLKAVTREEIIEAAKKVELDTVYFLKNKEGK